MNQVGWFKHGAWDLWMLLKIVSTLLSRYLATLAHNSLFIVTLGAVGIWKSESMSFSSPFSEEDKAKNLRETF